MCWNKEVSLTTFALAIAGVIYLYQRNGINDRWIAIFATVIAMIQLSEYFMWSDLACGFINEYASIFALLTLMFEPLANMIGGIYFSNTPHKNILKYMSIIYAIFIGFTYFTEIYGRDIYWCGTSSCVESNKINGFVNDKSCNLQWFFTKNISSKIDTVWIFFLIVPLLTMNPLIQGIILSALGFISLFIASIINNAAIGSLWCWLAIIIIYVKILFNYLLFPFLYMQRMFYNFHIGFIINKHE